LPFARLVGDDRVHLAVHNGRLLVSPADALAGLIEVRGVGLLRQPYEPRAIVGFIVDLDAADAERLPQDAERKTALNGILLPRLAVAAGATALPAVLALLTSSRACPD
jgi:serine kinase of HPr protein (carbohydrate metabolism regulator)